MQNILEKTKHSGKLNALTQETIHILEFFYLIMREFLSRIFTHNLIIMGQVTMQGKLIAVAYTLRTY